MNCKLNIIEPWEFGTTQSVPARIIKHRSDQFLLLIDGGIKLAEKSTRCFICKLKNKAEEPSFKKDLKGIYEIEMVFDESIDCEQDEVPKISSYRSNFLTGELII